MSRFELILEINDLGLLHGEDGSENADGALPLFLSTQHKMVSQ